MDHQIAKPDFEIVQTLAKLANRYRKLYCYPSQITLIQLHKARTGRLYSQRELNRHLLALVKFGWIIRKRRHKKSVNGNLELHSTLYLFTQKTIARIRLVVHSLASWAMNNLLKRTSVRTASTGSTASASLENDKAGEQNQTDEQIMTSLRSESAFA